MKKIFAVYAEVEIVEPPKWLLEFREKYSEPYDFHITLKQPCYVEESDITKLKEVSTQLIENLNQKSFKINFTKILESYVPKRGEKSCIMLGTLDQNNPIFILQKKLIRALNSFNDYVEPKGRKFEFGFKPHITIGDELNIKRYKQALKELPDKIDVRSVIKNVVLVIVKEATVEESLNPKNLTKYKL